MNKVLKEIYMKSPFCFKRIFANMEAIRRDSYRRSGNYKEILREIRDIDLFNQNKEEQIEDINKLISYITEKIPFFKNNEKYKILKSFDELNQIPIIRKNDMRKNINLFIENENIKDFFVSSTSGSTGTPFKYYRDKKSMRYSFAVHDRIYEIISNGQNLRKVRISGVNIVDVNKTKGPFWYYIDKYNQLQCSAYHISKETVADYVKAFKKYNVQLGTGYASSWLHLAEYIKSNENIKAPKLHAIITDSEGITITQKNIIQEVFGCKVYITYGLSEVSNVAVQCEKNHYHIISKSCIAEIVDEKGQKVPNGQLGEIVVTDLKSYGAPFIRYATGDMAIMEERECGCGWSGPYFTELVGRVEDYILTKDDRKIKRLGHLAKPAKGIVGMQLVQEKKGELTINVLPNENFEEESMNEVIKLCKLYIGDIKVNWNKVDKLEQTKAGKIKYIIRKF